MKKTPIIFSLFGHDSLTYKIQKKCHYKMGTLAIHQFPDEETVVRLNSEVRDRIVFFVANLLNPNSKILPLIYAAETARSLGAEQVILIAPYLTYMREDKAFEVGEGIASQFFAKLISSYFDQLVTIDPHLHRWHTLSAIYGIPTHSLHSTNIIATWIKSHIPNPILIGPDAESEQWVGTISENSLTPFTILEKTQLNETQIETSIPGIEQFVNYTPVLIDDIISTGMTMLETVKYLQLLEMHPPVCIGIHAVFAGKAYEALLDAGVMQIITSNTIPHISNAIDISTEIINFLKSVPEFTGKSEND